MTAIYQLPLFCNYPMSALFRMRKDRIDESIMRSQHACGKRLMQSIFAYAEITPIEFLIQDNELEIEEDGQLETGEKVFCFTRRYPFVGDTELWQFYPCELNILPEGEIFRLDLIMAVLETSERRARAQMAQQFAEVERIVKMQNEQIKIFHEGLEAIIASRLARPETRYN